jgi:hypothetical protein
MYANAGDFDSMGELQEVLLDDIVSASAGHWHSAAVTKEGHLYTVVHAYVCMHVCVCVCAYLCIHVCAYIYVCIYLCMYAYVCVCTHIALDYTICVCVCVCVCVGRTLGPASRCQKGDDECGGYICMRVCVYASCIIYYVHAMYVCKLYHVSCVMCMLCMYDVYIRIMITCVCCKYVYTCANDI